MFATISAINKVIHDRLPLIKYLILDIKLPYIAFSEPSLVKLKAEILLKISCLDKLHLPAIVNILIVYYIKGSL